MLNTLNSVTNTAQSQKPNQLKELQEIVQGTLEKQGILAKAQAELRKHVFEALCFTEQQNKKFNNVSPKIDENDVNDRFAMALIRDFLSYHQLDYTLSLMNTESQKKLEKTQDITRNEIASRLGLGAQKPNPSYSLLHLVVKKLFDSDVLKPRNSTLTDDVKLRPRPSNDSYRSTLDSLSISKDIPKQSTLNAENDDNTENNDNAENNNNAQVEDKINIDDALDELLDSSSNNDDDNDQEQEQKEQEQEEEEEQQEEEQEELKRIEQMNKTMEELRQQTSEFEKLKKESISPSIGTEYDEDFGTDEEDINSNIESIITKDTIEIEEEIEEDIDEDIDEDIEIDEEEIDSQQISNTDNIYSAKDDKLATDVKLENVADIIMNVSTQKIDFKL